MATHQARLDLTRLVHVLVVKEGWELVRSYPHLSVQYLLAKSEPIVSIRIKP